MDELDIAKDGFWTAKQRSKRKPHNHLDGYKCELRSKHPGLNGHIVIIDRQNGGDWIDADYRWVVMHIDGDSCCCFVATPSLTTARDTMKHVANGGDDIDLGQHQDAKGQE